MTSAVTCLEELPGVSNGAYLQLLSVTIHGHLED